VPDLARVVQLLEDQARFCGALGSPLYGALLERAAEDAASGGPTLSLLQDDPAPGPRGDALALRLMAAAHRLALEGRAPELAARLPSTRGDEATSPVDVDAVWRALHELIATRAAELRPLLARPCQTNEVGRAAALVFGFFEAAATGLPLRLLEVGASAGLNLRFEHFRYGGGGASWGPPASPVNLEGLWLEPPPHLPAVVQVAERRGCDRRPIDVTGEEGRLSLLASVWADQTPRFARLKGALQVAARVPARVEQADIAEWLPRQLEAPRPGLATVVYHSIVYEYLPEPTRRVFHDALDGAGRRARAQAPLLWVRLEPFPGMVRYGVTLTRWPGGDERLVALSGAHGTDTRRP
jgi:hypothetical protein